MSKINIVIVGAGFGGLQTALNLEKKFKKNKNVELTLIDQRDYHLFTPNLYEAASAEEELVTTEQVKQSVTLPILLILHGRKIKFIKGRVDKLETKKKQLQIFGKIIVYDYLILALGSESDFLNIEGADKYSYELKDLPDALRIRNQVEFAVQSHRQDVNKKTVRIALVGGGYAGLELAAELKSLLDFLAWKNQYPREKIEIEIVEANGQLFAGFDERFSRDAYERLRKLNIRVRLSARVAKIDRYFMELMFGERIAYDVLVWTAGTKARALPADVALALDRKGRFLVNEFFQANGQHNIFALGDVACVTGADGRIAPDTSFSAWHQAKYLAYALPYIIKNQKPPQPYKNLKNGFIVNLGGKWAIMNYGGFYFTGWLAYFIDLMAHLRYYTSLVGFWQALKCIFFQRKIFSRND